MHPPPSSIASALDVSRGFHFTFSSNVSIDEWPLSDTPCTLHLLHVLPPHVYADQYELMQRTAYTSSLRGTSDLELPVAAVDTEDSVLLLNVHTPDGIQGPSHVVVEVPLHARYGVPTSAEEPPYRIISLPRPQGFWACPSGGPSQLPETIAAYLSRDVFPHSAISVIPHTDSGDISLQVPVGRMQDLAFVDVGTASVILLMFVYLVFASIRTAHRLYKSPSKSD